MKSLSDKPEGRHSQRRMIYVQRILQIAEIVASRHFGVTVEDIKRELAEAGDAVCVRTIRRYLNIFIYLGYISREEIYPHGVRLIRYRTARQLPRTLRGA